MTSSENKRLIQEILSELSQGNAKPFVERRANDVSWTITGNTKWSRTYRGKRAVQEELLAPLFAQFADRYTATPHRFIAEDDYVVVEFSGDVTTKAGVPYRNTHCYVCRIADGRIRELIEYWDTGLAAAVLEDPPAAMEEQGR
jgi:ketosteroid isomerase-like protein